MNQRVLHFLLINGYGCHLDTPLGRVYLPKILKFIQESAPDYILCLGGFTQRKSAPGVSEAKLMLTWFLDRLPHCDRRRFLMDETSYTTLENSKDGAVLVRYLIAKYSNESPQVIITHGCEATRAASVVMLDRHFMSDIVESIDDITVETASWERADPFKQAKNLIYNKLAIKYPWLGLAEREHKKRVKRAEYI